MTLAEPFTLNVNPDFAALMSAPLDERRAAYADPAWRKRALAAWDGSVAMIPRWETYEVAESAAHPELVGRRLTELADERGTEPFDVLLDVALDEPDLCLRVRCILANDDPDGRRPAAHRGARARSASPTPAPTSASSATPRRPPTCSATGSATGASMTIEEAVHRLTEAQADLFGLVDRGGCGPARGPTSSVFDPATVGPGPIRRVADFPAGSERLTADAPTGVRHVLVNGMPIRVDGEQVVSDTRPGRLVAPGRS